MSLEIAIKRLIEGAPVNEPPTAEQLAAHLGIARAQVRATLSVLVFERTGDPKRSRHMVTCNAQGGYYRGDPQALYDQGPMR